MLIVLNDLSYTRDSFSSRGSYKLDKIEVFLSDLLSVSILAETDHIKHLLMKQGIDADTLEDIHPIRVQPSRVLSHIYARLGELNTTPRD